MDTKTKSQAQEVIDELQLQINQLAEKIGYVHAHKSFFDEHDIRPAFGYGTYDFDNLEHSKTIKVIQHFGGKWTKEYEGDKVTYSTVANGKNLRVWRGEPPANCKLVEYEEVVPARTVKKYKLQCKEVVTSEDLKDDDTTTSIPTN